MKSDVHRGPLGVWKESLRGLLRSRLGLGRVNPKVGGPGQRRHLGSRDESPGNSFKPSFGVTKVFPRGSLGVSKALLGGKMGGAEVAVGGFGVHGLGRRG